MKALSWALAGAVAFCMAVAACSEDTRQIGNDTTGGGTLDETGDASDSANGTHGGSGSTDSEDSSGTLGETSGTAGDTDAVCDEQGFDIEVKPVRVMILQDLSGSMTEVAVGSSTTKWQQSKAAMTAVLENPALSTLEWGYDYFPNTKIDNCARRQAVLLDAAPGNSTAIVSGFAKLTPDGATPLLCAMRNFVNAAYAPAFSAVDGSRYLLVVSDGKDNCEKFKCYEDDESPALLDGDFTLITQDLLTAGIRTFVIGFGNSDIDPAQLNEIAAAGGTPFDEYLAAENEAELQDAMMSVAQSVVSCTYEIKDVSASADPELVNFYFEKNGKQELVKYDEDCSSGQGWSWADAEHTVVEFCDVACSALQSGQVESVTATFGCPSVPVL